MKCPEDMNGGLSYGEDSWVQLLMVTLESDETERRDDPSARTSADEMMALVELWNAIDASLFRDLNTRIVFFS